MAASVANGDPPRGGGRGDDGERLNVYAEVDGATDLDAQVGSYSSSWLPSAVNPSKTVASSEISRFRFAFGRSDGADGFSLAPFVVVTGSDRPIEGAFIDGDIGMTDRETISASDVVATEEDNDDDGAGGGGGTGPRAETAFLTTL